MKQALTSAGKLLWKQMAFITIVALLFRKNAQSANWAMLAFVLFVAFREKLPVWKEECTPTGKRFAEIQLLIFGLRLMTLQLFGIIQQFLQPLGLEQNLEAYSEFLGSGWSMFFLTVLVAPLGEEILYRGLLLQRLLPHGKGMAIFLPALLFASQHAILTQSIHTFFMGVLLGAIAMQYGLRWSILLHALNNFFVFLQSSLHQHDHGIQQMNSEYTLWMSQILNWVFVGLGVLGILYFIWKWRKQQQDWKSWWLEYRPQPGQWWEVLTNGWMISYFAFNFLSMLLFLLLPQIAELPH